MKYTNNEIYFDLVEEIDAIVDRFAHLAASVIDCLVFQPTYLLIGLDSFDRCCVQQRCRGIVRGQWVIDGKFSVIRYLRGLFVCH